MAKISLTPSQLGFLRKTLQDKLDSLKTYDTFLHEKSTVSFYERNSAEEVLLTDMLDCQRNQLLVSSILEVLV